jgi:hypothetical protein
MEAEGQDLEVLTCIEGKHSNTKGMFRILWAKVGGGAPNSRLESALGH